LRSISAWRELGDKSYLDFATGSDPGFRIDFNAATIGAQAATGRLDLPAVRPDLQQEQFSQEFQLLGNIGKSWSYLAGIYYFHEKAQEDARPTRHIFSAYPFNGGTLYNIGSEYNEIENNAWAFFTQFTWTPDLLNQRLHLTLGWRHSEDSRDADRQVFDAVVVDQGTAVSNLLPATRFDVDAGGDYDDDSFTFIAEFDWSQEISVYAKMSEAYKSGGFNIRDPDADAFADGFEEEKLRAFELGFKGELLQKQLRFNSALFYQRFDDFQYNFQIPGTVSGTRVFNIDEGEMSGVELELVYMPLHNLFLQLSYAYLDSELDNIVSPFSGEEEAAEFNNAPKHTYSLLADYTVHAFDWAALNFNASYNFVDDRQPSREFTYRDAYSLVNARVSLSQMAALGGDWSIGLWGKNLQDSDYEAFTLDNLPQADRAVIWADGRTYGVDIIYRFQ
jgi:iron complex outermembrane receptor protein